MITFPSQPDKLGPETKATSSFACFLIVRTCIHSISATSYAFSIKQGATCHVAMCLHHDDGEPRTGELR